MPKLIACPACDQKVSIRDDSTGKRLLCPKCQSPLQEQKAATEEDVGLAPLQQADETDIEDLQELGEADILDENDEKAGPSAAERKDVPKWDSVVPMSGVLGIWSLGRNADPAGCLALHAVRGRGLAGCGDTIVVLDLSTGKRLFRFQKQQALITSLAISWDGRQVLSGDRRGDIALWELSSGRILRWLDGHGDEVRSVAFSPNGKYAVSGGDDGVTRLWELETGDEFKLFEARWEDAVDSVAFSPDGRQVLGAGPRVCTWSVKTGEPQAQFPGGRGVQSAAYFKDGSEIGACGVRPDSDNVLFVRRWQTATGEPLPCVKNPYRNQASASLAAVAPGSLQIVSTGKKHSHQIDISGAVKRSLLQTVALNALALPFGYVGYSISSPLPKYDPNDPYSLQIWSLGTGVGGSHDAGDQPPTALAISPDGSRALTASRNNVVCLWGLAT